MKSLCHALAFVSPERLKPKKIIFPEYDREAWTQGDRRTAATDVSIDKHVSQDLSDLAPDVEEFMKRAWTQVSRKYEFLYCRLKAQSSCHKYISIDRVG